MPWQIDPSHSQVSFSVRHLMISRVRGRFENFTGSVIADENNPTNAAVNVQIETASVNTRDEKRDGHLRSPDFFNAEQFPYMTFVSKKIEQIDDNHAKMYGDLTIRDITNEVALDVEYNGQSRSPWGTVSAGFSAETKISRVDWGLTWNVGLETGGVLVGDEVTISIDLELVKTADQPEEAVEAVAV